MYLEQLIEGRYVKLKSVSVEDAEFTLAIRQDAEFVKYLPRIEISLEQQKAWIRNQQRQADDYFWVVLDQKGKRIGTVGVFDIYADPPKVGRLAMKGNALQNIEAAYLAYSYGLKELKLEKLWGFIFAENTRAIRFAELFNGILEDQYESDGRMVREVVFRYPEFGEAEGNVRRMLYRERSRG